MRTFGTLSTITVLLVLMLSGWPRSASLSGESQDEGLQQRTLEKEVQAIPGQKLSLNLDTGGDVKIGGWDNNTVSVKAYLGGRDWRDCTVEVEPASDGVKVISRPPADRHNFSTSFKFE